MGEFCHGWVCRVTSMNGVESYLYDYIKNKFRFNNYEDALPQKSMDLNRYSGKVGKQ